jgi:nitrogen fixation-related uncharacterized protein
MTFIDVWIGYAIFGVTLFSVVFAWAVRTRQFSDLDRGRYIPLDADHPSEAGGGRVSRIDRWGLRVMVLIAAALLIAAVVVGIRNA